MVYDVLKGPSFFEVCSSYSFSCATAFRKAAVKCSLIFNSVLPVTTQSTKSAFSYIY
jgi:hypothetical protein